MSYPKVAIIAAGQSNIDGRVPFEELPNYLTLPLDGVHCCTNYSKGRETGNFTSRMGKDDMSPRGWAFDLVTYYYLTQALMDDIYVIKLSKGGTSIDPEGDDPCHWSPFFDRLDSMDHSLLASFGSLIRTCEQARGSAYKIRAMLWHQGEGDRAPGPASRYGENLRALIAYCRKVSGQPDLPFITATVSTVSEQYSDTVCNAVRKLALEDSRVRLIEMGAAPLRDKYHFNAASSEYFGMKAYDCLIDLGVVDGKRLEPTRPW
ncbi:MAG: sialate O-acetylesterase [Eubacteriales bacterium]|nr:sialate O-acetylesterase [Eubacteriales bacterium]